MAKSGADSSAETRHAMIANSYPKGIHLYLDMVKTKRRKASCWESSSRNSRTNIISAASYMIYDQRLSLMGLMLTSPF